MMIPVLVHKLWAFHKPNFSGFFPCTLLKFKETANCFDPLLTFVLSNFDLPFFITDSTTSFA